MWTWTSRNRRPLLHARLQYKPCENESNRFELCTVEQRRPVPFSCRVFLKWAKMLSNWVSNWTAGHRVPFGNGCTVFSCLVKWLSFLKAASMLPRSCLLPINLQAYCVRNQSPERRLNWPLCGVWTKGTELSTAQWARLHVSVHYRAHEGCLNWTL